MAEQRDRAGNRDAGGRAPRSQGWRQRAEGLHWQLAPDPSWMLSASEIGAFTFCPQAWYLRRCLVPVTAETDARRQAGSRRHREIGRQTDLVRGPPPYWPCY